MTCSHKSIICHHQQRTQQVPRGRITVVFAGAIILMGVNPDWPRKRAISKRPTIRNDWAETKRGVNGD